jgi:hypothetical protein
MALILRPFARGTSGCEPKSPRAPWTAKDVPLTALNPQDSMNEPAQQAWQLNPTPNIPHSS